LFNFFFILHKFFLEKRTTKFFLEKRTTKRLKKITTKRLKNNYKNPTGWGAGQPGFPCEDGVVGET